MLWKDYTIWLFTKLDLEQRSATCDQWRDSMWPNFRSVTLRHRIISAHYWLTARILTELWWCGQLRLKEMKEMFNISLCQQKYDNVHWFYLSFCEDLSSSELYKMIVFLANLEILLLIISLNIVWHLLEATSVQSVKRLTYTWQLFSTALIRNFVSQYRSVPSYL